MEMFDYMVELESNGLKEEFKKVELGDDERQFIKELIQPKKKLVKLWYRQTYNSLECIVNLFLPTA